MWRCAHFGQLFTVASGKKFGTANEHTSSAVAMIAMIFQRGEIEHGCLPWSLCRRRPILARRLVLRRLALGAHGGDHLAHLADADAVGDFDLDLVVVDHLGHLADQPAAR